MLPCWRYPQQGKIPQTHLICALEMQGLVHTWKQKLENVDFLMWYWKQKKLFRANYLACKNLFWCHKNANTHTSFAPSTMYCLLLNFRRLFKDIIQFGIIRKAFIILLFDTLRSFSKSRWDWKEWTPLKY